MSLLFIIVLVTTAGITILIGTALTFRRPRPTPRRPVRSRIHIRVIMRPVSCAYCGQIAQQSLNITSDGRTYDPICLDCQYDTGIRLPGGAMNPEYIYQVQHTF